jgi:hypothetical protein
MVHLPAGTDFDAARIRMVAELPSDAREERRRRQRGCWSIIYTSSTLQQILESSSGGRVEVSFFSRSDIRFNPRAVTFSNINIYPGVDTDC